MATVAETCSPNPVLEEVPEFVPPLWLRSGHAQTIVGRYLPGPRVRFDSTYHEMAADERDRLAVLESVPPGWSRGDPAAILIHGLAGCARAPYVVRVAARLFRLGVRVVRMNLRGAGAGFGLARGIYHAGRTQDVRTVAQWLARRAANSPIALVGFSLGGNLVLKLAAESATLPVEGLDCVLAANPPIDLAGCCRHIQKAENRLYDRNFLKLLRINVLRLHATFPDLGAPDLARAVSLYDFDDVYTAPLHGFAGADDYYAQSSAGPLIPRIEVPGLVVQAEDDPFIPAEVFRRVRFPAALALELISSGGHLGYYSRKPWQGDHRWLDARFATWLAHRWRLNSTGRPGLSHERATPWREPGGHTLDA